MAGSLTSTIVDPNTNQPVDHQKLRYLYAAQPDRWLQRVEPSAKIWWRQREIMRSVAVNRQTAIGSCNSSGKSYIAARLVPWFMEMYTPATVITTGPETRTVEEIIWREIAVFHQKAAENGIQLGDNPPLATRWDYRNDSNTFAIGFVPRDFTETAFHGFHNTNILVIIDEASGFDDTLMRGIKALCRGANYRILAISQETRISGWFYETSKSPLWNHVKISAYDSPNVRENRIVHPGIINSQDIRDCIADYGKDSWEYKVYILGVPPDQEEDCLMSLEDIKQASKRKPDFEKINQFDVEVGADIARMGSDAICFVAQKGFYAFHKEKHTKKRTTETAGLLLDFCDRVHAKKVRIDSIGVGAGVLDQVHANASKWIEVIEMVGSMQAKNPRKYVNAVTEWWDHLAGLVKGGLASGPVFDDRFVSGDLVSRKAKMLSNGLKQLEGKKDFKARLHRSPDDGDAVVMSMATGIKVGTSKQLKTIWGS